MSLNLTQEILSVSTIRFAFLNLKNKMTNFFEMKIEGLNFKYSMF